ncbi:hypothetical protein [Glycomyces salinus]|uniref:hypothetical protein n=1 Tax=Glycomyces salinus TaxID=980294 RepID=UPI0018ECBDF8|nr:hypothetical protein [Glycomyces salinus]
MTIEVQSYRGETGEVSYWLRKIAPGPEVTVGVRRSGRPTAVSNAFAFAAEEIDRALSAFLATTH